MSRVSCALCISLFIFLFSAFLFLIIFYLILLARVELVRQVRLKFMHCRISIIKVQISQRHLVYLFLVFLFHFFFRIIFYFINVCVYLDMSWFLRAVLSGSKLATIRCVSLCYFSFQFFFLIIFYSTSDCQVCISLLFFFSLSLFHVFYYIDVFFQGWSWFVRSG